MIPLLEELNAEKLLMGSHVMGNVEKITRDLTYTSAGTAISYDDFYSQLAGQVDNLPRITLDMDVAPGTESQYTVQLRHAMERVCDECDRVSRLVGKFESKVREAIGGLKRVHDEFCAWYALAAAQQLSGSDIKLPSAQAKQLSDSEFSRLTADLAVTMDSMLNVVKLLKEEIKEHKKTQADKYAMGKDQINASWTSHMPIFNGDGDISKENPGRLLEPRVDEEEVEDEAVPDFVSHSEPASEIVGTFKKTLDLRPLRVNDEGWDQ